jgi:DNA-binding protein Fis
MDDETLRSIDLHLKALLIVTTMPLRQEGLPKQDFGLLVSALDHAGMSQTESAALLGVNQSTVSRALSDRTNN